MKATELRIGNKVLDLNGNTVTIDGIQKHWIWTTENPSSATYSYNLIPITDKWLSDFGFYKNIGHYKIFGRFKDRTLEIADNNDTSEKQYYVYIRGFHDKEFVSVRHDLKYVHQLQNLYFALTGEELEIK